MLNDMGAKQPLLLHPGCPPRDDPGIRTVLELSAAVLKADWVRLAVICESDGSTTTYELGAADGAEGSAVLKSDDATSATLYFGGDTDPAPDVISSLSSALSVVLDCHRYRNQTKVLRAALDSTSSSVLLFDRGGDIVYANPPADRLLSLQTENELLVEAEGEPSMPLFTVLSSIVERVAASENQSSAWRGTLQSLDGRALACEVTRLPPVGSQLDSVLVLLQNLGSEPAVRIEAFCATHNLSPREREVVKLLIEGLTTVGMADRLGISPHTVRDHLKNLYRKTGTRSRSELLGLASRSVPAVTGVQG